MQKKHVIVVGLCLTSAVMSLAHSNGTSVVDDFHRQLNDPAQRLEEQRRHVSGADKPKEPLREMYQDAYKVRGLDNPNKLNIMLDRLWWQGADEDAFFRVLKTRAENAEHPERDGRFLNDDHTEALFNRYNALPDRKKQKIKSIKEKEMPDFLYEQAKGGYFKAHGPVSRFMRRPTLTHGLLGVLFGGMAGIGSVYVNKLSHELDWYAIKRHTLLKMVFDAFGHADPVKLRAMLADSQNQLSPNARVFIERFLLADAAYKTIRWRLHAALLAASGGGVGLMTLLGMHMHRHPVRHWRQGIERTA